MKKKIIIIFFLKNGTFEDGNRVITSYREGSTNEVGLY